MGLGPISSPAGSNPSPRQYTTAPDKPSFTAGELTADAGTDCSVPFHADTEQESGGNRALLYIGGLSTLRGS
jgi:hypothetical protein